MSIWNKNIESIRDEVSASFPSKREEISRDSSHYAFVDVETGMADRKVHDAGALKWDGAIFHSANKREAMAFLEDVDYVCGHNIIHHDAKYLFGDEKVKWALVDTLYVSPLLFPERPYHRLLKDDKLDSDQLNNPVNDCEKARDLLMDETAQWSRLTDVQRRIYASLLKGVPEFDGFLSFVSAESFPKDDVKALIQTEYKGKICEHADLENIILKQPIELAYSLALIKTTDYRSVTPPWVLKNYPSVEYVVRRLRHTRCEEGCEYCRKDLDVYHNLKQFFGHDHFRTYEGEPLVTALAYKNDFRYSIV